MPLEILHEPDDRLRVKSTEISLDDLRSEETQTLIDEMLVEMRNANGVGLAAPQVGVNKRIITVDEGKGARAYINPRIASKSFRKFDFEEGCLSVPGVWGFVHRHRSVTIKAFDRDGKKVTVKASGLLSVIFQHEIDHLDGVLFIDKVEKFTNPPRL
jgi:peptide deformylase